VSESWRSHFGEHIVQCLGCGNPIRILLLDKHARTGTYHNPGCLKLALTAETARRMIERVEEEEAKSGERIGDVGALPAV
jgi:hypothetical protein